MAVKRGLGRGLDTLFLENALPDAPLKNSLAVLRTSMLDPRPNQPRKHFDLEALQQLADSIALHGVLQPLLVREAADGRYQIIAGERRWRAGKLAGLAELPCVVVDPDELRAAQISLVENLQREDLNPLEEALAYRSLADMHQMTQDDIAAQVGKSRSAVANAVRLLELPEAVLQLVASGEISAGHARTLLGVRDREQQLLLARRLVEEGLSVRELEAQVKRLNRPRKEAPAPDFRVDYVAELETRMMQNLGRKVKIVASGAKKSVTLYYQDNHDLEDLLKQLCGKDFIEDA
ncbi:MAG: ParB/RepB/Spo0J family partition protein [Eubacteriales bacterium]